MITKRWVLSVLFLCGTILSVPAAADARAGGIVYESRPDEVALYLSDIAFVRDRVTLPAGQDARVLLPPGTFSDTLILTENGQRVHQYRLTPQDAAGYASSYVLTWDPVDSQVATRDIKLEYLLPGASWTPTYDMTIVDDTNVSLAFFAQISNSALTLEDTTVYLVAGRVDLSQQVNQVSMVTANQYMVGYTNESVELPALGVGAVNLQHVYSLGQVTANPGDVVYANLVDASLPARRLIVWNAATDQQTDVIYKVQNDSALPLAEGVVRVYEDGMFRGSDFIETTPVGSEGSVTVGTLPDVRVRREGSQEYVAGSKDYYLHTVTLEIYNYAEDEVALSVLDRWDSDAWEFEFSVTPERQPDNVLRWEVRIPAGETMTITYSYRTER